MKEKRITLTILIILTITITSLQFLSCNKKKGEESGDFSENEGTIPVVMEKTSHNWFYFTDNNFVKIDKPQNAPIKPYTPWTETVRISSANSTSMALYQDVAFQKSEENNLPTAFAIVNRLGVLCFDGNNISLASDNNIFHNRTAGNLVFSNNIPIFSVYKSAFFNDTILDPEYKDDKSSHLFLIQFDPFAKISYPLINSTALTEDPNSNSEVTDFIWDNNNWLCAVKTISNNKNDFSYISWKPEIPLLSLSPTKAGENIVISESTSQFFRTQKAQIDYSEAPKRIKSLLAGFSREKPFTIEVKTAGGPSPRQYINKIDSSSDKELLAKGIIAESWSGVLFEDGTFYLEGALPGKHILRNGKPIAIRLPKLPAGFIYSDFTISETTLYAAWEESNFYKTARSGFIQIDLNETLYNKLL